MELMWDENRPNVFYGAPREAEAIECKCGGYAASVDANAEECAEFGCGRDRPGGYQCCARAFVCKVCGARYSGSAEAPDIGREYSTIAMRR